MALVGTVTGIGTMAGILRTPLALTSALKIFANLSALVILCGGVLLLLERLRDPIKRVASHYFDWFFLLSLVGVALTGIMAELMRLAQSASLMYPVYFVHLVLIFTLFLYAPYSKFAHLAYRTVAMASAGLVKAADLMAGREEKPNAVSPRTQGGEGWPPGSG